MTAEYIRSRCFSKGSCRNQIVLHRVAACRGIGFILNAASENKTIERKNIYKFYRASGGLQSKIEYNKWEWWHTIDNRLSITATRSTLQ